MGESSCNQGPQSPLGGASLQNSWGSVASSNALINHTGVECDVNTINYGQPPPGHTQHQQVSIVCIHHDTHLQMKSYNSL